MSTPFISFPISTRVIDLDQFEADVDSTAENAALAEKWASEVEDLAVTTSPDRFSALHWAAKAAESATEASISAGEANKFTITAFAELATKFVDADPGEGQYILPVGAIVVDEKTGNRWERVTTGEHLDYTGAGGVKFIVLAENGEFSDSAFGVDGAGDDTAPMALAWSAMCATGATLVLTTSCTISGPVGSNNTQANASIRVRVAGKVTWTVNAGATAFSFVARTESTAAADCLITGGVWEILANDRAGAGIYFRHYSATKAGRVLITAQIVGRDFTENNASATHENGGIVLIGDFDRVEIVRPDINGVTRANSGGGACGGITVSGVSGDIVIDRPLVKNVLAGPGGTDADGIKAFNKSVSGRYVGTVRIVDPDIEDCQVRMIKTQSENALVLNPRVKRQMVVSSANSVDFGMQINGGVVINPQIEYRKNGATSPLSAEHSVFSAAFELTDVDGKMIVMGGTYLSEVQTNRLVLTEAVNTAAGKIETTVDGMRFETLDDSITALLTRGIVEVKNMDDMLACAENIDLIVRNVSGPIGAYPIVYTGYTSGGSPGAYLYCEASNIRNTGAIPPQRPFANLSGNAVVEYRGFLIRDNLNIQSTFFGATLTFDFQKLTPGCRFYCDIANNTITRGPSWGASGYGFVEVLDGASFMAARATDRTVRVQTVADGTTYTTHNGGTTWRSNSAT